ncbi:hypothetical protein QJS66_21055 [Kocuria rhizophila]|nr:hypothetical protein QJS66_21055 [Kocuria rhizophila]
MRVTTAESLVVSTVAERSGRGPAPVPRRPHAFVLLAGCGVVTRIPHRRPPGCRVRAAPPSSARSTTPSASSAPLSRRSS